MTIQQNYSVKIIIPKTHVSNLMHFQGEMVQKFPQKRGAEKRKR